MKKYKKKNLDIDVPEILSIKKTFIYKDNIPINFNNNIMNIEITPSIIDIQNDHNS